MWSALDSGARTTTGLVSKIMNNHESLWQNVCMKGTRCVGNHSRLACNAMEMTRFCGFYSHLLVLEIVGF